MCDAWAEQDGWRSRHSHLDRDLDSGRADRVDQPSVIGAEAIAQFFRETAARGDLSRMHLTPTRANGRPAVVAQRRSPDGTLAPHLALRQRELLEAEGVPFVRGRVDLGQARWDGVPQPDLRRNISGSWAACLSCPP